MRDNLSKANKNSKISPKSPEKDNNSIKNSKLIKLLLRRNSGKISTNKIRKNKMISPWAQTTNSPSNNSKKLLKEILFKSSNKFKSTKLTMKHFKRNWKIIKKQSRISRKTKINANKNIKSAISSSKVSCSSIKVIEDWSKTLRKNNKKKILSQDTVLN